MALIIRAVRAKKAPNLGLQRGFSLSGTLQERLFTGSRVLNEVVLVGSFSEVHMQDATAGGSRRRSGICYRMDGGPRMRLPNTAHTSRPWRIHEIARDFRLEDVWALPTPGGPDDFPRLVRQVAAGDPSRSWSGAARALWALRWKVGELLGWDRPDAGLGSRVPTLLDRLPADLRDAPSGPDFDPFTSLYLLEDEFAAEMANRTVHAVMHLGWVPDGAAGYRGQMAVLLKPNGLFGAAYMAAIKPFRYVIVYPALMRQIGREWRAGAGNRAGGLDRTGVPGERQP